jgi:CubicO group peptidase (beta-lactamase class C family)
VLTSPANPRIAGGCESTASEFARIMEMLRRGGLHGSTRVLSEAAVTAMLTRQTPPGIPIANSPLQSPYTDGADYGVGIWLDERDSQGSLRGALAAGARGFSAWIDFDDRMVGVFATDTTRSGNIQALLYLIRDAAALAVRRACVADINLDGVVSLDDFAALAGCMAGPAPAEPTCEPMISERADLDADGDVDLADFTAFQVRFSEGCP